MPKTIQRNLMLDLTNAGSRKVLDVRGVDLLSVTSPVAGAMGSAVVTLYKQVGGVDVAYSPSKVLDSSTPSILGADVDGIDDVALVVTTADGTATDMAATAYGEETA